MSGGGDRGAREIGADTGQQASGKRRSDAGAAAPTAAPVEAPTSPPADARRTALDVLDRTVTLELRGSNVAGASARLLSAVGLSLHPAPALTAGRGPEALPIHLALRELPVRTALDWIARQVRARYVLQGDQSVLLTRGYQWLARERLETFTARADALYAPGGGGRDLLALLRETVKPALWAHKDASLSVEPARTRVMVVLPEIGIRRIRAVLTELRTPAARTPLPLTAERRRAHAALLATRVRLPAGQTDPAAAVDRAAELAGISIGYRLEDFANVDGPAPAPRVSWDGRFVTIGQVLARVLAATRLTGYRVEGPRAIWLYAGEPPLPTQEDLWRRAQVVAIDLLPLARRHRIGAAMLIHIIKRRVAPGSWRDPATALAIHQLTGRLVVIHHPQIIRQVSALIYDLERTADRELWGVEK